MEVLCMFKKLEDLYEFAPLPLRVALAALFLYAGIVKLMDLQMVIGFFGSAGIPMPSVLGPLVAVLETLGGAFLLLGLWTRVSAGVLAVIMVVATVVTYKPDAQSIGMSLQLIAIIGALISLKLSGPGTWSLDEKFFWE
jgi:putative oxidoreductase